jgi:hypothetical protein
MVANRDFVELFVTIEFKPHADPLSPQHIDAILAALKEDEGEINSSNEQDSAVADPSSQLRRSCINIQLPVETPECGPQKGFVRASYGSVEVLRELEQEGTEWW